MVEAPGIFAIGDIHGCSRALDALLAAARPTQDDLIVTLGDYVDRGLDSAGVIDRLIRLSSTHRLVALRGNHEEMMMDARRDHDYLELWKRCGGESALMSYAPEEDAPGLECVPEAHWRFLDQTCRDIWVERDHFFVHGGVDANLPLDGQSPAVMHWQTFPGEQRPHVSGKVMVCGHTPQKSGAPAVLPHAICIDTGAGHAGWLTCLEVVSRRVWQANERGEVREAMLPAPRRRW
jgi:serine/threonine protein phosphatase 1